MGSRFKAVEVKPTICSEVALACAFPHNVNFTHGDLMEELELMPKEPGPPAPLDLRGIQ